MSLWIPLIYTKMHTSTTKNQLVINAQKSYLTLSSDSHFSVSAFVQVPMILSLYLCDIFSVFKLYLLCMIECTHSTASMWQWEGNLRESLLSFHHVSSRIWTYTLRLALSALTHWIIPLTGLEPLKTSTLKCVKGTAGPLPATQLAWPPK